MMAKSPIDNFARIVSFTLGALIIVVGADKFFNVLVNWDMYISPVLSRVAPVPISALLSIVGIGEMILGISLVMSGSKKAFSFLSAWLFLVSLNLLLAGFFDIAVLDLALAVIVFSLMKIIHLSFKPV